MTIEFCWRLIFLILIIHKLSLGTCEVPQKMLAQSVEPFWRLQTNKKTPKQAKYIYTRLLGRFAPFFYFNLLFVQCETKTKKFADFIIFFFGHFQNFTKKYKTFKHKFLKFWSFINLPWGHPDKLNLYIDR